MRKLTLLCLSLAATVSAVLPACAGPNDFFGNTIPTVGGGDAGLSQSQAAATSSPSELSPMNQSPSSSGPVEFTEDEKRMRKKYKKSLKHAQELIEKGDRMIKDGEARKDNKSLKRGQVLKGVGERTLEQLKTNNPLPEAANALKDK